MKQEKNKYVFYVFYLYFFIFETTSIFMNLFACKKIFILDEN